MMKDDYKIRSLLLGSCVALTQKGTRKWLRSVVYTNSNMKIKASVECRDVGVEDRWETFLIHKIWNFWQGLLLALSVSSSLCLCCLVCLFFFCCNILFHNGVSLVVKNSILHNLVSSGLRTMPRVYYMFSRSVWLELLMKNSVWSSWNPWGWISLSESV